MCKLFQIVLCAAIISVFVEDVFGLTCLKCESTDVNSRCRYGQRSKTTKKQMCTGPTAKCLVVATVNEYGDSHFQRGCTLEDICTDTNGTDIEFCLTCASKHCNYNVIELDKEVEEYLNEVREYEIYNRELLQNETKQANVTVLPTAAPKPKTTESRTVTVPKSNRNRNNKSQDNTPLAPNQIIVGYSDEEGVPISAADEPLGIPNSETHKETSKSNESPKRKSDRRNTVNGDSKSNANVEYGTKLIR